MAAPTTALWRWLYEVNPDYPNLYLDGSGHLKLRTAREMLEACEEVLDGRLRPAPLDEDSSEGARVLHACIAAFARGYGLDELAEWEELSESAARAALARNWPPLTAAERRFYVMLSEALTQYLELREDVRAYPQWSGVDFGARQLRARASSPITGWSSTRTSPSPWTLSPTWTVPPRRSGRGWTT